MGPNYAIKPTPEQALRTNRTMPPARLIAALALMPEIIRHFKPHPPLPVEATIDEFVVAAGGTRVSDLVGASPPFLNADYIFESEEILVELKVLTTEWPQQFAFGQQMSDLWLRHEIAGNVWNDHIEGKRPLPREVRRDFLRLLRKPVKRILEKANRQLRETRVNLKLEHYFGLVFIVADGLPSVAPEYLRALVSNILLHDYSEIKCFVIMTVNKYVDIPGDGYARLLWVPTYHPSVPQLHADQVNALGEKWVKFLGEKVGGWDAVSAGVEASIEGARFIG